MGLVSREPEVRDRPLKNPRWEIHGKVVFLADPDNPGSKNVYNFRLWNASKADYEEDAGSDERSVRKYLMRYLLTVLTSLSKYPDRVRDICGKKSLVNVALAELAEIDNDFEKATRHILPTSGQHPMGRNIASEWLKPGTKLSSTLYQEKAKGRSLLSR